MSLNLTFSGAGFIGIYHVGAVACLKLYGKKFLKNIDCFGGSSAGALSACMLLCDVNLDDTVQFVMHLATKAQQTFLGPLSPSFDPCRSIKKVFLRCLPIDAYKTASKKLHISLTRISDWENVVVSNFESNEELVDALICSSFIPFFSGVTPPKFHNEYFIDGGFTDNLPQQFHGTTITVSPFSGESDICPDDGYKLSNRFDLRNTSVLLTAGNIYRMSRALFPPNAEVLSDLCQQGFEDTLSYLHLHYPELLSINVDIVSLPNYYETTDGSKEQDTCSTSSESLSDIESVIATRRVIGHLILPDQLNQILQDAKELLMQDRDLCVHFAAAFYRLAKWSLKPYLYLVNKIQAFVDELLQWLLPQVVEFCSQYWYAERFLKISLEIFHAYKGTATYEWHPNLKKESQLYLLKSKERLASVQKSMVAFPKFVEYNEDSHMCTTFEKDSSTSDAEYHGEDDDASAKETFYSDPICDEDVIYFNIQKDNKIDGWLIANECHDVTRNRDVNFVIGTKMLT